MKLFYDTSMSKPKKAAFILKAAYRDLKSIYVETAWALMSSLAENVEPMLLVQYIIKDAQQTAALVSNHLSD